MTTYDLGHNYEDNREDKPSLVDAFNSWVANGHKMGLKEFAAMTARHDPAHIQLFEADIFGNCYAPLDNQALTLGGFDNQDGCVIGLYHKHGVYEPWSWRDEENGLTWHKGFIMRTAALEDKYDVFGHRQITLVEEDAAPDKLTPAYREVILETGLTPTKAHVEVWAGAKRSGFGAYADSADKWYKGLAILMAEAYFIQQSKREEILRAIFKD